MVDQSAPIATAVEAISDASAETSTPNSPPSGSASGADRSWSLIWHLIALAIAAFVPAMALSGWLLARHIAEAKQHIDRSATTQAQMWAQSIDQVFSGAVGTLRALAASAALRNRDYKEFAEQATESFNGTGISVRVRDRKLAALGAAREIVESAEALLSPAEIRAALKSGQPIVTDFREAASDTPAGVDIWIRAGPSRGEPVLLQARIPSDYLSRSLTTSKIETLWTVALTDAASKIVARSRDYASNIGSTLAIASAAAGTDGAAQSPSVIRGVDASGAPIIEAVAAAGVPGWRIATVAPRSSVEQTLDQHWQGFIVIATLLGCVMAGATSYVASSISRSVSTLSANARGLASSAPFEPVKTTIREVRDLMETISETRAELVRRKAALRDSDHRLRMALDAGGMGVWEWDRVTDEMIWDPVEFDLAGLARGERAPKGQEFVARVLEEDRPALDEALAGLSLDDPAFSVDFRFRRYDGEVRWIAGRGLLLADENGAPRGLIGVNYDTTEQRENIERTASLLREVSHRSKNMLALILAMARLTARDATDVQTHLKEFSARVAGLAASQDLIVAADWRNVDIAALAAAQAKSVAYDSADRVAIDGPALCILPEAAQTLGMVFAELTLNAIQHGALSAARGRVDLTWKIDGGTIHMTWRESGGPPYEANGRRGYGMSVVERFAEQGLKASAQIEPKKEGLIWSLTAPLQNLSGASPGPAEPAFT